MVLREGVAGEKCNLHGHFLNIYTPFLMQCGNQDNNKRVLMQVWWG